MLVGRVCLVLVEGVSCAIYWEVSDDSGGCILCWWRVCLVLLGSMHVRQPSGATGESGAIGGCVWCKPPQP